MASHARQLNGENLLLKVAVLSQPPCGPGVTLQAIVVGVQMTQLDGDFEGTCVILINVDHAFFLGLYGSERP
jgi:hypothetical protein